MHVFEKDGDDWQAGFLGDVINARLAGADANAIAASTFRKNHEVKFAGGAAKVLKFANASGIEFAAFEEEADAAAKNPFNPGGMPDGLVAENENGVAARPPAKATKEDSVEQADVIADEKVAFGCIEVGQAMGSAEVRDAQSQIRANPKERLDGNKRASDARLKSAGNFERGKTFGR